MGWLYFGLTASIIEALFTILLEKFKIDVMEIFPNFKNNAELMNLRLKSFINAQIVTENISSYLNDIQNLQQTNREYYLELFLSYALQSDSEFNFEVIFHKTLLESNNILKRDSWWSIFIHNNYTKNGKVKQIIEWSLSKENSYHLDSNSLYLSGITLSWFLTSSNRELRDTTTKALVNLFTNNINIFLKVLKEFERVDDLYVLERLYAVGYGITLRSDKLDSFVEFGNYIYDTIFNQDEIVEHILLRDYAKLTIEYINNIFDLNIDIVKLLPPYGSKLPSSYPTDKEIDTKYDKYTNGISSILSSMVTVSGRSGSYSYGDFGRYTFQSELMCFDHREYKIQDLSNYAVEIIFNEYITDKKLFEISESNLKSGYGGRMEHRVERIGKKYQWLVLHKILAIISDNYKIENRESFGDTIYEDYQGTYQLYIRDIDQTSILKNNEQINNQLVLNIDSNFENIEQSNLEWMGSKDNLPTIKSIVNLYKNEKKYFLLDSYFSIDGNKDNDKYRNLYYSIHSFIVKKEELSNIIDYINKKGFDIGRMPESNSFHDIFLKEYPNSLSYEYIDKYYYGQMQWESVIDDVDDKLPSKILLTSTKYSNDGGSYDLSVDGGIQIKLPNK